MTWDSIPVRVYDMFDIGEPVYAVITVCGSMRYWQKMLKAAELASRMSWVVLFPFVSCEGDEEALKLMLDDMHEFKIRQSSAVLVVGEYVGESTRREIEYARSLGKAVYRYREVDGVGSIGNE